MPTNKMLYDPLEVPDDCLIWEYYPRLQHRRPLSQLPPDTLFRDREVAQPTPREVSQMVSVVILQCDRNSPYFEERDFALRGKMAMESLSLPQNSKVRRCIKGNHPWYNLVMTSYLSMMHDHVFESWVSLGKMLRSMKALMRSDDWKDDDRVLDKVLRFSEKMPKLEEMYRTYEDEVFSDKEMAEAAADVMSMDDNGLAGWAELYALDPDEF